MNYKKVKKHLRQREIKCGSWRLNKLNIFRKLIKKEDKDFLILNK
jgi:hypothetical protein